MDCVFLIEAEASSGTFHCLGISDNGDVAVEMMQQHWPFAEYKILHEIRSGNRSELLYRILRIRYHQYNVKYNWYVLSARDVQFIQTISDKNYQGLIRKMEDESFEASGRKKIVFDKKVVDVTLNRKVVMTREERIALRDRLIAEADEL